MSCDFLPTERQGNHYQGDVRDVLHGDWDLMVGHPPCTYIATSGINWNYRGRGWEKTEEALNFVRLLMDCGIPHIALENPISLISTRIRKPDQIINPFQFGHDARKATCLWLKNLPPLVPTKFVEPRIYRGRKRWGNQYNNGHNNEPRCEDRWKNKSRTFEGIAEAMAEQWELSINSHAIA